MSKSWYEIKAAANPANSAAEIHIYGDIGESWWAETVAAKDFVDQLAALDAQEITVRINSIGGSVPDGLAIHNAIARHPAKITTSIDGVALSIASLIALAGDTVEMAENAVLMIHAPWTSRVGNAVQLREAADMLDTWAAAMSKSYARKSGQSEASIEALLTDGKDHYYTAEEAKAAGFIDRIATTFPMAAANPLLAQACARWPRPSSIPAASAASPFPENFMTQNAPAAAVLAPAAPQPELPKAPDAAAILAAETARRAAIRDIFTTFPNAAEDIVALGRACEDDVNCDLPQAREKLLAALGKSASSIAGRVVTVADEGENFRVGAQSAILARAGLEKDDARNPYRGHTLLELARASLRHGGQRADGMNKMEVVAAAFTHSTSDFPLLLADAANKSMMKGYSEAEETFQKWTSTGSLPDFKAARRVDLNTFPSLTTVPEGGEYQEASFGERGETIKLATYGKMFSITRQSIINDDLDAFSKIPRNMGRAAIRTVGNLVYAVLIDNAKMADGKTLFHADHANLMAAAEPTTASLDEIIRRMRLQKDPTGSVLGIRLSYVICPVALEGKALLVANSEFEIGAAKDATIPNIMRGRFEVISDPRLDGASASIWYGAASSSIYDTIEVAYLDGQQSPVLEQQNGWTVDGVQFKVRLDAGVKALDFRTLSRVG